MSREQNRSGPNRDGSTAAMNLDRLRRQVMSSEEAAQAATDVEAMLTALQTCLHLLGEEGYFFDPDYPEVQEALALYERLVDA